MTDIVMSPAFSRVFCRFCLLMAFGLALVTAQPVAAQSPELKVTLLAKRVTTEQGKEILVTADKARPGDVIQYEASYQNNGQTAVQHVGAVVPIPAGLILVADSATPAAAEASLDGKTFSPAPLMRAVKNETGIVENRPVPLTEYRALRWMVDTVPAGGTTTVTLRARVATNGRAE
jgi:uncharacterized repeat protein (TIGR01451 family)